MLNLKVKLREAKSRVVVVRSLEEEMRRCWSKFQLYNMSKFWRGIQSTVPKVNTILYN